MTQLISIILIAVSGFKISLASFNYNRSSNLSLDIQIRFHNSGYRPGTSMEECKAYIKTKRDFREAYDKQKIKMEYIQKIVDQRRPFLDRYLSGEQEIRSFFLRKPMEFYEDLTNNQNLSVFVSDKYRDILKNFEIWQKTTGNSFYWADACHQIYGHHMYRIQKAIKLINEDHIFRSKTEKYYQNFLDVLYTEIQDPDDCTYNWENNSQYIDYLEIKRSIYLCTYNHQNYDLFEYTQYHCRIEDPVLAAETLIAKTYEVTEELTIELETHATEFVSKLQHNLKSLLSSYSSKLIQRLSTNHKEISTTLESKRVSSFEGFSIDTLNRIKSECVNLITIYQGYISNDIIDNIQQRIDSLQGLSDEYSQLSNENNSNNDSLQKLAVDLANANSSLNQLTAVFAGQTSNIMNQATSLSEIAGSKISTHNIIQVANVVNDIVIFAQSQLEAYENDHLRQFSKLESTLINSAAIIDRLGEIFETFEGKLTKLINDFGSEQGKITHLIDVIIPAVVRQINQNFLNDKVSLEEIINKMRETEAILKTVESNITKIGSAIESHGSQFEIIKTKLNSCRNKIDQAERDFDVLVNKTRSNESKLLIAVVENAPVFLFELYERTLVAVVQKNKDIQTMKSKFVNFKDSLELIQSQSQKSKSSLQNYVVEMETTQRKVDTILMSIMIPPKEFRNIVTQHFENFVLDKNVKWLNMQIMNLYENMESFETEIGATFAGIDDIEASEELISSNTESFIKSIYELMELLKLKILEFKSLVSELQKAYIESSGLIEPIQENNLLVIQAEESKEREIIGSVENDSTSYNDKRSKLLVQKTETKKFIEITKDFYKKTYNVESEELYQRLLEFDNQYEVLLKELASINNSFTTHITKLVTQLDTYKREAKSKYQKEITLVDEIKSEISATLSELKESIDHDSYDNLILSSKATLTKYSEYNSKFAAQTTALIQNISGLTISLVNYNEIEAKMNTIVAKVNSAIAEYEEALKNEYITKNKQNIKENGTELLINSASRQNSFITTMGLNNLDRPGTGPYDELVADITNTTDKFNLLKLTYLKLDVDSIVKKYFPQIPILVENLTQRNISLVTKIVSVTNTYKQIESVISNFNPQKRLFESIYTSMQDFKTKLDLKVDEIIGRTNDKITSGAPLEKTMQQLNEEKNVYVEGIKIKSEELNQSFETLRQLKSEYDKLVVQLQSTMDSLADIKSRCDPELVIFKGENEKILIYLQNITLAIENKNRIMITLNSVDESLKLFKVDYLNEIESRNADFVENFNFILDLLVKNKKSVLNNEIEFSNKLNALGENYQINNNNFNSEMQKIITSQFHLFSRNIEQYDMYIEQQTTKKQKFIDFLKQLKDKTMRKLDQISFQLLSEISNFDVCKNTLQGKECHSGNCLSNQECLKFINHYDIKNIESIVASLRHEFSSELNANEVNSSDGDIGVDILNKLDHNSDIMTQNINELEKIFTAEFKKRMVKEVELLVSVIKSNIEITVIASQPESDSIQFFENQINGHLDRYRKIVAKAESNYSKEKQLFLERSSSSLQLSEIIEKECKNTYIIEELRKGPTVTDTLRKYTDELRIQEEFFYITKNKIEDIEKETQKISLNSNSSKVEYLSLTEEIGILNNQLIILANDNKIIDKDTIIRETGKIKTTLHAKKTEIDLTYNKLNAFKRHIQALIIRIQSDSDNAAAQIVKFENGIEQETISETALLKKLNSLQETCSTVTRGLNDLSALKSKIKSLKKSLSNLKEESFSIIKSNKSAFKKLASDLRSHIDTEKHDIDILINLYIEKYQNITVGANRVNTDIPQHFDTKYEEYTKIQGALLVEYSVIIDAIANYSLKGNVYYASQENAITEVYIDLIKKCDKATEKIDVLSKKITQLSPDDNPDVVYTEHLETMESLEQFLSTNSNISFDVEKFNKNLDTNFKQFTLSTKEDLGKQVRDIEETAKALENSINDLKHKESITEADPVILGMDPIGLTSDSVEEFGVDEDSINGEGRNIASNDYFKVIIAVASVVAIAIVIGSASMFYKYKMKREIYQKCDRIYIKP